MKATKQKQTKLLKHLCEYGKEFNPLEKNKSTGKATLFNIEDRLLELGFTKSEISLYRRIVRIFNLSPEKRAFVSISTLAQEERTSRGAISRYLKKFMDYHLLSNDSKVGRGNKNNFKFLWARCLDDESFIIDPFIDKRPHTEAIYKNENSVKKTDKRPQNEEEIASENSINSLKKSDKRPQRNLEVIENSRGIQPIEVLGNKVLKEVDKEGINKVNQSAKPKISEEKLSDQESVLIPSAEGSLNTLIPSNTSNQDIDLSTLSDEELSILEKNIDEELSELDAKEQKQRVKRIPEYEERIAEIEKKFNIRSIIEVLDKHDDPQEIWENLDKEEVGLTEADKPLFKKMWQEQWR
jgi:hypothetical protein